MKKTTKTRSSNKKALVIGVVVLSLVAAAGLTLLPQNEVFHNAELEANVLTQGINVNRLCSNEKRTERCEQRQANEMTLDEECKLVLAKCSN